MTESIAQTQDQLREAVRQRYAAAASRVDVERLSAESTLLPMVETDACCGGISTDLYANDEVAELPEAAVLASLGCGNPTALAELKPGETVLDLGSGGGIDVLLSARRVGPTGFAYGLDMTDEMLALAEKNRQSQGVSNVRFLKGEIEHVPLPNDSVDVIISNCVINLSADKPSVLREAFRVLKPGGRFAVSDVVAQGELPADIRRDMELWAGCIAGALEERAYRELLSDAGFDDIDVEVTRVYDAADLAASECCGTPSVAASLSSASGRLVSAFVRARKPTVRCGTPSADGSNSN